MSAPNRNVVIQHTSVMVHFLTTFKLERVVNFFDLIQINNILEIIYKLRPNPVIKNCNITVTY